MLAARSFASGELSRNWYWVLETRSSMVRSCTGCMYAVMPGTWAVDSASRRITSEAEASRCANGFSVICMRPVFKVALAPSTPMNEARWSTSGSWRMASASACWRLAMASNEVVCVASVMTWIRPVSCTGKNPLGTTPYSRPVRPSVTAKTPSVVRGRSSTQVSARP